MTAAAAAAANGKRITAITACTAFAFCLDQVSRKIPAASTAKEPGRAAVRGRAGPERTYREIVGTHRGENGVVCVRCALVVNRMPSRLRGLQRYGHSA